MMGEMEIVVIAEKSKNEVAEVITFLNELSPEEKKDFLSFIQGVRFAKNMKPTA